MEILLVEDTPADAELAQIALRRCAYAGAVTHLPDGERAIAWLERRDSGVDGEAATLPRLVLLDLKMPRVDGHALLGHVKGSARLRRLPLVVFTSSREERDIARAYELGANSYIVKPVEFGEYCAALAEVVRYWAQRSEQPSYAVVPAIPA